MSRAERDAQFTEFLHARRPWLRRIAFLLCQDTDRAEQLTEQVLLQVYLDWRKAQRSRDLDAYVRALLVRKLVTDQADTRRPRREQRHQAAATDDTRATAPDLITALGSLETRERAVVVLRFYCELPAAEIADILHTSEPAVHRLTADGLATLQSALGAAPFPGSRRENHHAD